jgi:hypothetical protein
MEAIVQANETSASDTLLLRRTYPELEKSLLNYFRKDVPRELYRSYNDSKHVATWWNNSTTRFGYCRSEHDVYQYQGAEFLFIGIDELTLFTLKQWQFLTSRNRCPVAGTFPNMAGATNPGNVGHAWVKALWIDRVPAPGMERPEEYDPADHAFIAARVWDNPIYAQDANYLKTLNALPRHLRQAFLDGDWNVFAGQYFDLFDVGRHTARTEELGLQPWWPRWVSVDWGFHHPAAVYWHATAPDGRTITYREFVQSQLSPRMLAQAIVERSVGADGKREKVEAIYLSPDAFARRTSEATIAEQVGEVLSKAGLPQPTTADDDRIGGWMLMYQMLESGGWLIAENCAELIRTLPILTRDDRNVEDILKMEGDDACLAQGTLVQCHRGLVPIDQVKPSDRVLTRQGWRRVLWSGMTALEAKRLCLRLSDGTKLVGTATHPLLLNGQWVRLDRARYGDTLMRCTRKPSSIEAAVTAGIRALRTVRTVFTSWRPASEEIVYCTVTSGGTLMGLSPLGITSTTSMGIRSTTRAATLNALQHASILLSILRPLRNWSLKVRGVWRSRVRWLRFGINQKRVESLPSGCQLNSCASEENARSARNVESHSGDCLGVVSAPTRAGLAGGGRWVWITLKKAANAVASFLSRTGTRAYAFVPVYVLGVTEETPGPVYNLTVEGQPEFFANGILVHNCDAARYGLKSRLRPGHAPLEQRVLEHVTATDPTSRAIQIQRVLAEEERRSKPVPRPSRGRAGAGFSPRHWW